MAMSGGIDSGVAAMLLREQGYDLVGVTFRTFDSITESCMAREKGCCSVDSIFEAKHLAESLGFEHHILDARDVFRRTVIQNFVDEYLRGRTPNPCVLCNPIIKWGELLRMADELHCDKLATGHYARIGECDGRHYLRKGADTLKDQTYFLWRLTSDNLARTIFPLGDLTKPQVRELAAGHGFVKLSQKKESEEICFVPDNNYRNFLKENVPDLEARMPHGEFVSVDGRVLGEHEGLYNYTIGQRRGLGIALGAPAYVVALDGPNNRVVIGEKQHLQSRSLLVERPILTKYDDFADGFEVSCRIRYRNAGTAARLYHADGAIRVEFDQPVESVTPGQSAVFYEGDDVVGGGVIVG
jgi:tRNA-specific 2-thiouridylase